MNAEQPISAIQYAFPYKTLGCHIQAILAKPLEPLGIFLGCFGSVWTVYEASVNSLNLSPNRTIPYATFVGVSMVAAIASAIHRYLKTCPDRLEMLSPAARRIAHLQRPMWEFRFTKSVLAQLLSPIERECRDLFAGKTFVPATPLRSFQEYFSIMGSRPENLTRMVEIAQQLILNDLPHAMISTEKKAADPLKILDSAIAIQRLFEAAVNYERAVYCVKPPNACKKLHELQIGQTEPIRKAILQLFQHLQAICDLPRDAKTNLSLITTFGSIPNSDEFLREFARVAALGPEALQDEWGN